MPQSKPQWKHPEHTREGKVERATWVMRDAERQRIPVANVIQWLKEKKGLSDDEVTEALNAASGGELVKTALGGD